jgi:Na+-transporting NADH:ubiquinone oxidoreductase subunit A
VPRPADSAAAILVRAIDTNPLAPDPRVVIADRPEAFAAGIRVLGALADTVYVCQAPGPALSPHPPPPGVRVVDIDGPHPAGLPGTLVAHLAPVSRGRSTWHVDAQDVIAVGELFTSGRYPARRVVALGGPGALRPRLLGTVAGAAIDSLLDREIRPDARVVLGSILVGREPEPGAAFLGCYDSQITVLDPQAGLPRDRQARRSPGLLERVIGRADVMLPLERFERLWPLPFPLLPLLRAVLVGDCEAAARLGCLNLAEEDMALCEYACPGRQAYGAALRAVLDELEPDADESSP